MFFAAGQDGYMPLEMSGVAGTSEVKNLQAALTQLAAKLRRPASHPGPANGVIGERTMTSVASMMDILQNRLPSWASLPIMQSLTTGVASTEAKNTVGRYVTELRIAADRAANEFGSLPELPSFQFGFADGVMDRLTPFAPVLIGAGVILLGFWLFGRGKR